jgi:hypothetical protein
MPSIHLIGVCAAPGRNIVKRKEIPGSAGSQIPVVRFIVSHIFICLSSTEKSDEERNSSLYP